MKLPKNLGFSGRLELLFHIVGAVVFIASALVSSHAGAIAFMVAAVFLATQYLDRTPSGRYSHSISLSTLAFSGAAWAGALLAPEFRKPLLEFSFWAGLGGVIGIVLFLNWFLPFAGVLKAAASCRSEQIKAARDLDRLRAEWGEIIDLPFETRRDGEV
ncbi:MAG: hypothetical protein ING19_18915 [Azospirillum sp.]|nr:hypothetical protein [Azospirillum sp.]